RHRHGRVAVVVVIRGVEEVDAADRRVGHDEGPRRDAGELAEELARGGLDDLAGRRVDAPARYAEVAAAAGRRAAQVRRPLRVDGRLHQAPGRARVVEAVERV